MNSKKIRKEFFFIRKAFFEYHLGFFYLYCKYYLTKRIYRLRIIEKPLNNKNLSIHVLTGQADFTMLLWSLKSFYRHMTEIGQLYIHSDGSLNQKNVRIIKKLLPSAIIIYPHDIIKQLSPYPVIHKFRIEYPEFFLLKKIVDTFFISDFPLHLIIDSDLFWFNHPTEITREIQNSAAMSLTMKNSTPCYVYFKTGVLEETKAMVNTGVVLYNKRNFDLQKLSNYLESINLNHKQNLHFIEQAAFASSLRNVYMLPEKRYCIKGPLSSQTVVRHYTNPRRLLFFTEAIPRDLQKNYLG